MGEKFSQTYVAGALAVRSRDADDVLVDVERELYGAGQVGDGVHCHVPQDGGDAVGRVGRLAPTAGLQVTVQCSVTWWSGVEIL